MVDFELFGHKNMLADNSRVIFINIKFILIMQKIILVILSDFDSLKLYKILEIYI